ncbi:MAG: tetratricopeptide repeat protein [Janthinobacterium lividum]
MILHPSKKWAALGTALLLTLLAGAAGAQQTPGGGMGNGQDPSDRTDNGTASEGSKNSDDSTLSYNTAVDDYNHKKYADAANEMKDYLKQNNKDARAHRFMADIFVAQNNIAGAIPEWEVATRLDRSDKTSRANLGIAYLQVGSYDKAVSLYQAALLQNPKDDQMQMQLGIALDNAGKQADAIAAFEKSAALNPRSSGPPLYAGLLNHKTGHDDKAVPELKTALALGTTEKFQAYAALAEAASAAKQSDEAIKDYTLAAQAKPDDFVTQANLGVLEQNAGNKSEAEAAYQQAVTLKADSPTAMAGIQSNLALLLIDNGKLDEAAALLVKATQGDPTNAYYQNNLGQVYEKQGKKDLAIAAYTKAIELDPGLIGAKDSLATLKK